MRSCLDIWGKEEREREQLRSDFSEGGEHYAPDTPPALSPMYGGTGKGTGHYGHEDTVPMGNEKPNVVSYRNFDSDLGSGAGNMADNRQRMTSVMRSRYSQFAPYMPIETYYEGQYVTHGADTYLPSVYVPSVMANLTEFLR